MQKNKGSIIFLSSLIVIVAVFGLVFGILSWLDSRISVKEVTITNITDTAFTVTWVSDSPYIGRVVYQEESKNWSPLFAQLGKEIAYDDRDVELNSDGIYRQVEGGATPRYTHHVTIRNLDPETQYEFRIAGVFNGKTPLQDVATTRTLIEDIQTPDPAYGLVEGINGGDSFVLVVPRVFDENIYVNGIISTTISAQGTYSLDLNTLTTEEIDALDLAVSIYSENSDSIYYEYVNSEFKPFESVSVQEVTSAVKGIQSNLISDISAQSDTPIRSNCKYNGIYTYFDYDPELKSTVGGPKPGICCDGDDYKNSSTAVGVCEGGNPSEDIDKIEANPGENIPTDESDSDRGGDNVSGDNVGSSCGDSGYIEAKSTVNVRFAPGINNSVATQLSAGDSVQINECREISGNYPKWYKITYKGSSGWVAASVVSVSTEPKDPAADPGISNIPTQANPAPAVDEPEKVYVAPRCNEDTSGTHTVDDISIFSDQGDCISFNNYQEERENSTSAAEMNSTDINYELGQIEGELKTNFFGINILSIFNRLDNISTKANSIALPQEEKDSLKKRIESTRRLADELISNPDVAVPPTAVTVNNEINQNEDPNTLIFRDRDSAVKACQNNLNSDSANIFSLTIFNGIMAGGTASNIVRYDENLYKVGDDSFRCVLQNLDNNQINQNSNFISNNLPTISAQETPGSNGSVLQADDDGITVQETGNYAFFSNDSRIAEQDIVVIDGEVRVRLFTDTNGNGQKDDDEEYFDDYSQITVARESSIETFQLSAGWNLIHLPLIDQTEDAVRTAGDLIDYWNGQGADIKHVARFRNGQFEMFSKRESGTEYSKDFDLVPGQGLFLLNFGGNVTTSFAGNVVDQALPLELSQGWNLVGFYNPNEELDTEGLFAKAETQSVGMQTISQFENGQYQSVISEDGLIFGNNFNVIGKRGYFVRIEGGSSTEFTP